jgi:hypothetical protein
MAPIDGCYLRAQLGRSGPHTSCDEHELLPQDLVHGLSFSELIDQLV